MWETPDTLRAFRDTLVRHLVEGPAPAALLMDLDPVGALLHLQGSGQPLVVLTWEGDRDLLAQRIRRIVTSAYQVGCHVAIVGGDAGVQEFLGELRFDQRVALHHVRLDGSVWTRGRPLKELDAAARAIAQSGRLLAPLGPADVGAGRAVYEQAAAAHEAFRRTLATRKPRATMAIIAVCVVLYVAKTLWGGGDLVDVRMGAVSGERIRDGEWWRLLAGTFLHADPLHIGANMFSLWSLGRFLEPLLGTPRYTVLYVLAAIGGSVVSSSVHTGFSVGASGAVFGLLGALAAVAFRHSRLVPASIVATLKRTLWQPILINVVISFMPGVDATAHAGGAVTGLLLVGSGLLVKGMPNAGETTRARAGGWWVAAGLCVAACLASIGLAVAHGRPWEIAGGPTWERRNLPAVPFTIEIPNGLALESHRVEGGVSKAVFGDVRRDLIQIEVAVEKALAEPGPADAKALDVVQSGEKLLQPAHTVELEGGRQAVFAQLARPDGTMELRLVTWRDGFRLGIRALLRVGSSPGWENAFSHVVTSVTHRE